MDGQLNLLDSAATKDDADQCCDRIEQLIDKLLKEREEIRSQCKQPSVIILIILDHN